jgi:hypothetical protein
MGVIATIEDAIVAALTAAMPPHLPIETLPAGITADEWGLRLRAGTAVYVAWMGASSGQWKGTARLDGNFAVYVVSKGVGSEVTRRRGDDVRQGAYLMIEMAAPAVNLLPIKGIGTLELVSIDNLYSEAFDKLGLAVYSMLFQTQLAFDKAQALEDFTTFSAQLRFARPGEHMARGEGDALPLADSAVDLDAVVTLPSASSPGEP